MHPYFHMQNWYKNSLYLELFFSVSKDGICYFIWGTYFCTKVRARLFFHLSSNSLPIFSILFGLLSFAFKRILSFNSFWFAWVLFFLFLTLGTTQSYIHIVLLKTNVTNVTSTDFWNQSHTNKLISILKCQGKYRVYLFVAEHVLKELIFVRSWVSKYYRPSHLALRVQLLLRCFYHT